MEIKIIHLIVVIVTAISIFCYLKLATGEEIMEDAFYSKLLKLEEAEKWEMLTDRGERVEPSFKRFFELPSFDNRLTKKIDINLFKAGAWPSKYINNYALSPDGKNIAFMIYETDETTPTYDTLYSLYVLHIKTGEIKVVFPPQQFPQIGDICYSSNGKNIFFIGKMKNIKETSHFPQFNSLYKLDIQTQEITEIVQYGVYTINTQSCSPDGKKIVYQNSNFDEIYISDLTTASSYKLVDGKYPTWSPDGSKIAYWAKDGNYYLINPDGSDNKLFLLNKPKHKFKPFGEKIGVILGEILWSPDGQYVYYERVAATLLADVEHYVPYIMDVNTKEEIRLSSDFEHIKSWVGNK